MSEFNEQDNIIEEETPVLHLELEESGQQSLELRLLMIFSESSYYQ